MNLAAVFAMGLALAADSTWYVLPRAAYDSDDGLGGGFMFEAARLGREPYRWALSVGSYATVRGYHHHQLRWDRPGPPGALVRWTVDAAWRQWTHDGYWGVGGDTTVDPARDEQDYRYSLVQPYAYGRGRFALGGPWSVWAGLNPKASRVGVAAGSLLAQETPYGVEGGVALPVMGGLLFDTREPEVAPQRGVLAELSGRGVPLSTGQAGGFSGLLGSVSAFAGRGRLVLAGRLMAEWLFGQVPFYEMVHWGGYVPVMGFGGSQTLRGVPFGRWRGPGKAVANLELRCRLGEHGLLGRRLAWELAPFADAGLILGDGPLHPSAGLGVRPILDGTFVGRIDLGVGPDPLSTGETRTEVGVYVTFGHAF